MTTNNENAAQKIEQLAKGFAGVRRRASDFVAARESVPTTSLKTDREAWLINDIAFIGRTKIDTSQYVELRDLAVRLLREIASLKAAGNTVESALAELREMSPEPHLGCVFVTQKFCYSTEDEGSFEIWNIDGGLFGDVPIVGRTLAEAMQWVREFAAEKERK